MSPFLTLSAYVCLQVLVGSALFFASNQRSRCAFQNAVTHLRYWDARRNNQSFVIQPWKTGRRCFMMKSRATTDEFQILKRRTRENFLMLFVCWMDRPIVTVKQKRKPNPRIIAASAVLENGIFEYAKTTRINLPIDSFVHSVVMFSYSCVVAPTNQFTRMEPAQNRKSRFRIINVASRK